MSVYLEEYVESGIVDGLGPYILEVVFKINHVSISYLDCVGFVPVSVLGSGDISLRSVEVPCRSAWRVDGGTGSERELRGKRGDVGTVLHYESHFVVLNDCISVLYITGQYRSDYIAFCVKRLFTAG